MGTFLDLALRLTEESGRVMEERMSEAHFRRVAGYDSVGPEVPGVGPILSTWISDDTVMACRATETGDVVTYRLEHGDWLGEDERPELQDITPAMMAAGVDVGRNYAPDWDSLEPFIAELYRAMHRASWRPIETAPKEDGVHILVARDGRVYFVFWDDDDKEWLDSSNHDGNWHASVTSDYWMPMPKAPS